MRVYVRESTIDFFIDAARTTSLSINGGVQNAQQFASRAIAWRRNVHTLKCRSVFTFRRVRAAGSFTIKSNVEWSRCLLSRQTRHLSSRTEPNVTRRIPSANIRYCHTARVWKSVPWRVFGRIESLRVNPSENHATDLRDTSSKSEQLKLSLPLSLSISLSPIAARRDS